MYYQSGVERGSLYRNRYVPNKLFIIIGDDMNTKYDITLPENFSGKLLYKKTEYLYESSYLIEITFHNGNIFEVEMNGYREYKGEYFPFQKKLNESKWNSSFWIKSPQFVNCDDCNYRRLSIVTIEKPSYVAPEDTIGIYV